MTETPIRNPFHPPPEWPYPPDTDEAGLDDAALDALYTARGYNKASMGRLRHERPHVYEFYRKKHALLFSLVEHPERYFPGYRPPRKKRIR